MILLRNILVLLILSIPIQIYSQNTKVDSLIRSIPTFEEDTSKVDLLLDISNSLFRYQPDSAIVYAAKSLELAQNLKYQKGIGYAYKNYGLAYYIKGDFTEVLNYWKLSLAAFQEMDFKSGISNILNNLGAVYFSKGEDPQALEYYLESLRIAEEIPDSLRVLTAHVNIGGVYSNNVQTYPEALKSYEKSLAISEDIDYKDGIATSSMNMGELYMKQSQFGLAIPYLERSIEAFEATGGEASLAYSFLGATYDSLGQFDNSLEYFQKSFDDASQKKSKSGITKSLIGKGNTLLRLGDLEAARKSYLTSIEYSNETNIFLDKRDAYLGLSKVAAGMRNFKDAYTYQNKYNAIIDTIRSEEYDEKIGNLRFQFDLENKEKEITLLNKDNAIKEQEIERSSLVRKFLYALAGFLLVIVGGVTYQYRYATKTNKLLETERNRSESILLNILPKETADELKNNGFVKAKKFEQVTVLFTDFKNFSQTSDSVAPEDLVKSVDYYFRKFDEIVGNHNLEKIKTIGDAYMCAGGLPSKNDTNAEDAYRAAFEMLEFVEQTKANPPDHIYAFDIRIGLNTGPVVAGIVGTKKFQYDIWGRTVNIASRMESNSEPGKINISDNTYQLVKDKFKCEYRGEIEVKNSGELKMYFAVTNPS